MAIKHIGQNVLFQIKPNAIGSIPYRSALYSILKRLHTPIFISRSTQWNWQRIDQSYSHLQQSSIWFGQRKRSNFVVSTVINKCIGNRLVIFPIDGKVIVVVVGMELRFIDW